MILPDQVTLNYGCIERHGHGRGDGRSVHNNDPDHNDDDPDHTVRYAILILYYIIIVYI